MRDSMIDIILAVVCLVVILGVFVAPVGYLNRWFRRRTVIDYQQREEDR